MEEYSVQLYEVGANRIEVIRLLREEFPNIGVVDIEQWIARCPTTLLEDISKERAERIAAKLMAAGATASAQRKFIAGVDYI